MYTGLVIAVLRKFKRMQPQPLIMICAVLSFAIVGTSLLLVSRAATQSADFEPENGTKSGTATVVSDTGASGGSAVKFSAGNGGFAVVCGMKLCIDGQQFTVHGATTYGQLDNATAEVNLAKQAGVNVLEIVEYEQDFHVLASQTSEATWSRIDRFVAAAKAGGVRTIINLSSYGQSLQAAGQKPTTTDWNSFLQFVLNRTNTQTGVKYKDEPNIIMYELFGEIDAPNYSNPTRGTTQETTSFFSRTLAQFKAIDTKHLVSTGGFSYLNDPGSGIDWQTIMADPNNAVCGVEINSYPDRNVSVPNVANYCNSIGKPWFLAAWSSCKADKWGADDINNWPAGDADMAMHARDMYKIARASGAAAPAPTVAAIGSDFWNLAPSGTCDIGPTYPQTMSVVQEYAP